MPAARLAGLGATLDFHHGLLAGGSQARGDEAYDRGYEALDEREWERAIELFAAVIEQGGSRVDASLYWTAYAQNKLGRQSDALETIAALAVRFPESRYLGDGRALEVEVRGGAGQPPNPDALADEELKLLAIQGLQHTDPERAFPLLERVLKSDQSARLKSRALFVLAQSDAPAARQILGNIARDPSQPDLQRRAVEYLGVHGGRANRELLGEIYASSEDREVKRRVLRAFMVAGERQQLLDAAMSEPDPELRKEAIRQLGPMGAQDELWQLYQKETSPDLKKQMLNAMFVGGGKARLTELARSEPDTELRRAAIRNLGLIGGTADTLLEIYAATAAAEDRAAVVQALFVQGADAQLVSLARQETDPALKKHIVNQLSIMGTETALQYLMEILER